MTERSKDRKPPSSFTGEIIDGWFRSVCAKPPWPERDTCDYLAVLFNGKFVDPPDLSKLSIETYTASPLTWEARKRRLDAYRIIEKAAGPPQSGMSFYFREEEQAIAELRVALAKAKPFIIGNDRPKSRRPWAVCACVIGAVAQGVLIAAGRRTVGINRNSSVARFTEFALRHLGFDAEREAIAFLLADWGVDDQKSARQISDPCAAPVHVQSKKPRNARTRTGKENADDTR